MIFYQNHEPCDNLCTKFPCSGELKPCYNTGKTFVILPVIRASTVNHKPGKTLLLITPDSSEEELKLAYQRDTADKSYREEVALWDVVVGDGIE